MNETQPVQLDDKPEEPRGGSLLSRIGRRKGRPERRSPLWKRRFYVHPLQRKYFLLSLVPLMVTALLLILLLFVPLQMAYTRSSMDPDRAFVVREALVLVSRIWPAILLTMMAYAIVIFFTLHRLVGALPRIERMLQGIAKGDLPSFIRVRPNDDLREFAGHLDEAFRTLILALKDLREHETRAAQGLADLQQKVRPGGAEVGEILNSLKEISRRHQEMAKVLSYFNFPTHSAEGSTQTVSQ